MSKNDSKFVTKLSPLIENQVPDFVQADHPIFVQFLKHYYQYLESGELRLTVDIDNLLLDLESESFALDMDGNKIVLESGAGNLTDNLVLDGTIPLNEGIAFFELEQDTFIKKIEFIADNKQIVHHVNAHLIAYDNSEKQNIYKRSNSWVDNIKTKEREGSY